MQEHGLTVQGLNLAERQTTLASMSAQCSDMLDIQMRSKLKTLSYVEHALSVYENN